MQLFPQAFPLRQILQQARVGGLGAGAGRASGTGAASTATSKLSRTKPFASGDSTSHQPRAQPFTVTRVSWARNPRESASA